MSVSSSSRAPSRRSSSQQQAAGDASDSASQTAQAVVEVVADDEVSMEGSSSAAPSSSSPLMQSGSAASASASPLSRSSPKMGNGGGGGGGDYVNVVVRLKPKLKRLPDAYMPVTVRPGSLHTSLGRLSDGTPSARNTPRTARVMGSSRAQSFREPRTARASSSATAAAAAAAAAASAAGTVLTIVGPSAAGSGEEERSYEFGKVLDASVSDDAMCDSLVPDVLRQLNAGYNVCMLCYGQTGSGKTHTINTLAPALTKAVFEDMGGGGDHDVVVEISYVQIYQDKAYDLLSRQRDADTLGAPLPRPRGQHIFEPKRIVKDPAEVQAIIKASQRYRCISSHALNARSSRSHTLLSLHTTKWIEGAPLTTSTVTLADLAGAERVKKSGAAGDVLDEAIGINKSLFALHSLILATAADSDAKPYRDSLLNMYLAPRLRHWHIVLIVTVSLDKSNFSETKSSLDFAATAKGCLVTKRKSKAVDRVGVGGAESYEETCKDLRAVVEALRRHIDSLQEKQNAAQECSVSVVDVDAIHKKVDLFRTLLADREEELQMLSANSHLRDSMEETQKICEANQERTLKLLAELTTTTTTANTTAGSSTTTTDGGIVENLADAFLCAHALFDSATQRYHVQQRAVEGLRSENRTLAAELVGTRRQVSACHEEMRGCHAEVRSVEKRNAELQNEIEELHMRFYSDHIERAAGSEIAELYRGGSACSGGSTSHVSNDNKAVSDEGTFEEQQAVLTNLQQEVVTCNEQRAKLLKDYELHVAVIKSMWSTFTPQQKARYCDCYGPGAFNVADANGSAGSVFSTAHSNGSNNNNNNSSSSNGNGGSSSSNNSSSHRAHAAGNSFSSAAEKSQLQIHVKELQKRLDGEVGQRELTERRLEDVQRELDMIRAAMRHREDVCHDLERAQRYNLTNISRLQQQVDDSQAYFKAQNMKQAELRRQIDMLRNVQDDYNKLVADNQSMEQMLGTLQRRVSEHVERDTEFESLHQRCRDLQLKNEQYEARIRDMDLRRASSSGLPLSSSALAGGNHANHNMNTNRGGYVAIPGHKDGGGAAVRQGYVRLRGSNLTKSALVVNTPSSLSSVTGHNSGRRLRRSTSGLATSPVAAASQGGREKRRRGTRAE